jgi:4'-phosphopantetheinyl transferase EntD
MLAVVDDIQRTLAGLAGGLGDMAVATSLVPDVMDGNELVGQERLICHSFRHPRRRAEFLAGRVAARRALRVYLGGWAEGVEVGKHASGAPIVAGYPDLRLSISHSNRVAVAIAAHFSVGVDIELCAPRPESFTRHFFTQNERQGVARTPTRDRQPLLSSLWTRKEAVCKVGHWGGRLVFSDLDCLGDLVTVDGRSIRVASARHSGYAMSVAVDHRGDAFHG